MSKQTEAALDRAVITKARMADDAATLLRDYVTGHRYDGDARDWLEEYAKANAEHSAAGEALVRELRGDSGEGKHDCAHGVPASETCTDCDSFGGTPPKSQAPKFGVWVTVLYYGSDGDEIYVDGTEQDGDERVRNYCCERAGCLSAFLLDADDEIRNEAHPPMLDPDGELIEGGDGLCVCQLFAAGKGDLVFENWDHDSFGEGSGRWEGPQWYEIPAAALAPITDVIDRLLAWEDDQGGWQAPEWDEARALRGRGRPCKACAVTDGHTEYCPVAAEIARDDMAENAADCDREDRPR